MQPEAGRGKVGMRKAAQFLVDERDQGVERFFVAFPPLQKLGHSAQLIVGTHPSGTPTPAGRANSIVGRPPIVNP